MSVTGASVSSNPFSTRSSHSNTSNRLPSRHVSQDGSIVIESHASSSSSPISAQGSKLSRWAKKAKDTFFSVFKFAIPSGLFERWMSKSVHRTALEDPYLLFSISLFLSPEDVANASAVCSVWKRSLGKKVVWKNQYQVQGYAPVHPDIETHLRGSDGCRFLHSVLTIIAEYDEPRINYKAVFAAPISNAIMPRHYATHFRNVQVLNPIPRPSIMRKENNKPDPDQPGKTIGETHIWTYRPGNKLHINGNMTMLTMNILKRLVRKPLQGHRTRFECITSRISQEQRDSSMGEEGWDLMTKAIFEDTRDLPFNEQQPIVTEKGYETPSGPDVILTTLVWRVLTGEYLFYLDPVAYSRSFTRTTSLFAKGIGCWAVGWFGPRGLQVVSLDRDGGDYGLVGLRKFS